LKNKAHTTPDEQYEMERFRIEDGYGQEVTEKLVKKDKGGALLGQLINLEALLSLPQGEVADGRGLGEPVLKTGFPPQGTGVGSPHKRPVQEVDPNTNQKRPIPPKIVMERDQWELENLPFLPDRQHHCAQWMMWHVLGLSKILARLLAGEEYSANDPDVIKLAEVAHSYRDSIKSVLGFWIPDNCSSIWLLGMLLGKLGLKTANRKRGSSGQQVKFYSLAVDELVLATQVLSYRHEQRLKREEKKLQHQEDNRLYQIMRSTQFGWGSDSISTPTQNTNIANKQQGVNMAESEVASVLEQVQPGVDLLNTVAQGLEVIKGLIEQVSLPNKIWKLLLNQF
jgi:hypothetical protein